MATLPDLPQTEIAILEMTNAFRTESKLGAVKPNAALTAAARAFAEYLARTGQFAHEADGRQPAQRAEASGYRYCLISENLAMNLDSRGFEARALAREAVEGWKNSPGHRANMLRPTVTEIGVAVARAPDRDPKFISVQVFGRPVPTAETVAKLNAVDAEAIRRTAARIFRAAPTLAALGPADNIPSLPSIVDRLAA